MLLEFSLPTVMNYIAFSFLRVFHNALRLPRLPPYGTMIQLREFKGLVEVRRERDSLAERQI
jgi:hypothetical protein